MAKVAVVLARKGKKWTTLGTGFDLPALKKLYKELILSHGVHNKTHYEEIVYLNSSREAARRKKYPTKKQLDAKLAQIEAIEQARLEKQAAEQKAEEDRQAHLAEHPPFATPADTSRAAQPDLREETEGDGNPEGEKEPDTATA